MPSGYSLDILSASWGPLDVTNQVRNIYSTQAKPGSSVFSFTPSNGLFGNDPLPGAHKCFVMVWRVIIGALDSPTGPGYQYSTPQTVRVLEPNSMSLDYSSNLQPYNPASNPPNNLVIFSASYFTLDVTSIVSGLNKTPPLSIPASNTTFGTDPQPTKKKSLTVTYAYISQDGTVNYNMKTVVEGQTLVIPRGPPPALTIHAANFGGQDVTYLVQQSVTFDQTFATDGNTWPPGASDPLPGKRKTFSVLYQYGDGPLEVFLALEKTGVRSIIPFQTPSRSFFNPSAGEYAGRTNVLAVLWGAMQAHPSPVSPSIFTTLENSGPLSCTNGTFGFDGLPGVQKTAVVFYRYGITGPIQCAAVLESSVLYLNQRNAAKSDPLSGRGLLRSTDRVHGFYLRALANSGTYLALTTQGLAATATTITDAALFNFVPTAANSVQCLQITAAGTASLVKYAQVNANNQLALVDSPSAASQFDYELVTRASSLAVLINLSTTNYAAPPLVLMTPPSSTSVSLMPLSSMTDPICCYYGYEWNLIPQSQVESEAEVALTIDPCTFAFIAILKDWTFDLLSVLGNFHYFQMQGTKILNIFTRWWSSLSGPTANAIATILHSLIATANTARSAVSQLLGQGITLLQYLWDVGAFWYLFSNFVSDIGWWDVTVMTANVALAVAEALNPASMALKIAGLGLWVAGTINDLIGGYNACAPGTSAAVRSTLFALHGALRKVAGTAKFLTLDPRDQVLVANQLLTPHYSRIIQGDTLWPPSLKAPPKQDPDDSFDVDGNIRLLALTSASVADAVETFRAPFEAELDKASKEL